MLEIFISSLLLFTIGFCGILFSQNSLLITIISVELMLLSSNIMVLCVSLYLDNFFGYLIIYYILTMAACETAIGLAIIIAYFTVSDSL
jgi:NADH-quinone oxidoreductase subunit K